MSWRIVTDDWRLKLLAVGLAILMLGAVAFSENPPTTKTLPVSISYQYGPNIVLIDPPTKVNVTINGLADVIQNVLPSNLIATADATKAAPGQGMKLNVTVRPLANVNVTQPAPIAVNIDKLQTVQLPVTVQAPAAPGWQVTKAVAVCPGGEPNPCTVNFTGPASWESNLTATVTNPGTVSYTGPQDTPNLPIVLSNDRGLLDLTSAQAVPTYPTAGLDVTSVTVHIEAKPGSTYSTVPLVVAPLAHPPASGYQVTNVTVTPTLVTLTGSQTALAKIRNITLQAADLSGRTSDATFQIEIQYPNGVTGDTATALVVYSISRIPNTSPSPP